jgi:hypothetical protein
MAETTATPTTSTLQADDDEASRGSGNKKARRHSRGASISRRIHAKARERQAAWLATEKAVETERLTRELNGRRGLFADRRQVLAPDTCTDDFDSRKPGS